MSFIVGSLSKEPQFYGFFDLDWTLIRPNKGKFFNINSEIRIMPNRISVLKQMIQNGFTLAIVSNQTPRGVWDLQTIKNHMNSVYSLLFKELNVEVPIMVGVDPVFRKPAIGWLSYAIPYEGSFMCGDAAGRPGDFSDSDLKFAENGGIKFYTPEELFPQSEIPAKYFQHGMIILVGAPGSGKSTFAQQLIQQYPDIGYVCSDQFKSRLPAIIKKVREFASQGKAVIIDATNGTISRRGEYLSISREYQMAAVIVHLINAGEERNKARTVGKVPDIAIRTYWKNFEEPTNREAEIIEIF